MRRARTRPDRPGPAQVKIHLRRFVTTAPRGWMLGLDKFQGVTDVRILDCETEGTWMKRGHVSVEVWGGDRRAISRALDEKQAGRLGIVFAWHEATRWRRFRAWLRWVWWLARYQRPYGLLPRWLWRTLPRRLKTGTARELIGAAGSANVRS